MRLVNADDLPISCWSIDDVEDIVFVEKEDLDNAPTIDAIPVEWIDRLMSDGTPEESKAAWRVLKAWNKEQEAMA